MASSCLTEFAGEHGLSVSFVDLRVSGIDLRFWETDFINFSYLLGIRVFQNNWGKKGRG